VEPEANNNPQKWQHPGGKLRELGAETLTNGAPRITEPQRYLQEAEGVKYLK